MNKKLEKKIARLLKLSKLAIERKDYEAFESYQLEIKRLILN